MLSLIRDINNNPDYDRDDYDVNKLVQALAQTNNDRNK